MNRPYSVWTDRVESEVTRKSMHTGPLRRRIKAGITHWPMAWLERAVIRRASLGLFHGQDTFEAYAPYCANAQVVHNIHIGSADHISKAQLASKIGASASGPLTILYTGRAVPMKGPHDWVAVLVALANRGVPFRAQWLGDGSELPAMQRRLAEAGLQDRVALPGFVSDRAKVLQALREAHVFLFTHLTPESPRCLIEAMISGTPIFGYDSPYARDLIEEHGGGRLVPRGDVNALTDEIARLADNRHLSIDLMKAAHEDGAPFNDETVFRHRSDLIKAFA